MASLQGILGAGCIARVYEGTLNGQPVAIKIRRENVEELKLCQEALASNPLVPRALWSGVLTAGLPVSKAAQL